MSASRSRLWRTAAPLALVALVAGFLAGCAEPAASLPEGLRVDVMQFRDDQAARRLQLKVVNDTAQVVTVTRAVLSSPRLAEDVAWEGDATVPSGSARDLRVTLPPAVCGGTPDPQVGTVHLTVTTDGGDAASGTVAAADPIGSFAQFTERDCFERAVFEHIAITLADAITTETRDGTLLGRLELTLTGAGDADGSARVTHVLGTTLLQPLGDGKQWPLDERVFADSTPTTIPLEFVPARCDPHAVAEDKRGSLLPIGVELETGQSGTVYVAAPDAARLQIYDYIGAACGWGG